ncbi:MAG TPA: hypothetical protein VFF33_07840 [Ignavibacteriaceae bacterium]|nr:hypothetical protein [Ignavibacteriaceae bacterium]
MEIFFKTIVNILVILIPTMIIFAIVIIWDKLNNWIKEENKF